MLLPLFAPGGLELAVILVVSLLLFSPLVALAYVLLFRPDRDDTEERVADLEAEVADLRERLDDGGGADAPDGGAGDGADGDDRLAGGRHDADRDDRDGR